MPELAGPQTWTDVSVILGSVLGVIVVLAGWFGWLRPRWRRLRDKFAAVVETLIGRDAVVDKITRRELVPAQPGVGVRLANTEDQMKVLTQAVADLAQAHRDNIELHKRVDAHETRISNNETRLQSLEDIRMERVVTQNAAAEAWRAIADRDIEPPEVTP